MRKGTPWFNGGMNHFFELKLQPGQYYRRMARPLHQHWHRRRQLGWYPDELGDVDKIAIARGQLTTVLRQLERICQTVHPTEKTFDTFGHDIRNLLILSCAEVESHWREVLTVNGVRKDRYTTTDYARLNAAMRLDEYKVSLPA